jgi:hypothetical protein
MDPEELYLHKAKKEIEQLQGKLDLVSACAPSRATEAKKRLVSKLLAKKVAEIDGKLRISNELPPMLW